MIDNRVQKYLLICLGAGWIAVDVDDGDDEDNKQHSHNMIYMRSAVKRELSFISLCKRMWILVVANSRRRVLLYL